MVDVSGCVKYLMFIFNFLFWLCGIIILVVGIWIQMSKDGQKLLRGRESGINPYAGVNILIVVGVAIMVLWFLGYCGTIHENHYMLLLFFIGLFLILHLQVATGIPGAAFRSEKILNEILHKNVELLSPTTDNAKVFQETLSELQEEFKCCGLVSGPADWGENFEKYSTSCECLDTQLASCMSYDNKYIYSQPCISFIKDLFKKQIDIIIGIAFGLAVIEIIGMIFAMVLFWKTGNK